MIPEFPVNKEGTRRTHKHFHPDTQCLVHLPTFAIKIEANAIGTMLCAFGVWGLKKRQLAANWRGPCQLGCWKFMQKKLGWFAWLKKNS